MRGISASGAELDEEGGDWPKNERRREDLLEDGVEEREEDEELDEAEEAEEVGDEELEDGLELLA